MKSIFLIFFILSSLLHAQIPPGYYDSANGLTDDSLKYALNQIIKDHNTFPYTSSYTDVWDILKVTDQAPDSPDSVICIYTG
jgi:hypothetical protein